MLVPNLSPPHAARGRLSRIACLWPIAACWLLSAHAGAQDRAVPGRATVDEIDSRQRADLARVDVLIANRQWTEAVDALERFAASAPDRSIAVDSRAAGFVRYLPVSDYAQTLLASWHAKAPEALAIYRRRVDPRAKDLWERATRAATTSAKAESIADYAAAPSGEAELRQIARDYSASSFGDRALDRLAQIALDSGEYDPARRYWKAIELNYPDTKLSAAQLKANQAVVSILQRDDDRASLEIELLRRMFPRATGRVAGRDGNLVELAQRFRDEGENWPRIEKHADWPTFAGNVERSAHAHQDIDPRGTPLWSVDLPSANSHPYFPIVVDGASFVFDGRYVRAFDLQSGAAWPDPAAQTTPSGVFFDSLLESAATPALTLSASGRRIYARFGTAAIQRPFRADREPKSASGLAAFDGPTQRLLFRIEPPAPGWEFEGAPACRGDAIYVALRRIDQVQPQLFVAAYDALTGKRRWHSERICSAPPAAADGVQWLTALVTLHEDAVYIGGSLGAIAALDAATGRLRWSTTYPRVASGGLASPCLAHRGVLFAAPADSDRVFALDAATGAVVWRTRPGQTGNARQLLGVGAGRLIVSGDRLYWLDAASGRPRGQFPAPGIEEPGVAGPIARGAGRGLLARGNVYFPTSFAIYVFRQETLRTTAGWLPQPVAEIDLASRGASAGNLVAAHGVLLIAGSDRLMAYRLPSSTAENQYARERP